MPTLADYKNILITGGAGFVGLYLTPKLVAAYPNARGTIVHRALPAGPAPAPGWSTRVCNLLDRQAVGDMVATIRPDLIIHLAAQSSVATSRRDGLATWDVNFGGSFALAEACAKVNLAPVFLFVSSSEAYGLSFNYGAATEATPLQPISPYGRAKAAAEAMLIDVLPISAKLIVVRAFNHTGPGQDTRFVLPSFALQIARAEAGRGAPVLKVGNLEAARDFLDVADVCEAYIKLLSRAGELKRGEIFNVSSGVANKIGDLLDALRAKAKCEVSWVVDPERARPSEVPIAVGRNDKIRELIGWQPTISLNDTLYSLLEDARRLVRAEFA